MDACSKLGGKQLTAPEEIWRELKHVDDYCDAFLERKTGSGQCAINNSQCVSKSGKETEWQFWTGQVEKLTDVRASSGKK